MTLIIFMIFILINSQKKSAVSHKDKIKENLNKCNMHKTTYCVYNHKKIYYITMMQIEDNTALRRAAKQYHN